MGLDHAQEDMQHGADGPGLALQKVAKTLRHRQDPLANGQRRKDMINQVRGRLGHAPGVAGRAKGAPLTGEGYQEVVAALGTSGACEPVGEDAALQVAAEFPLHVCRHPLAIPVVLPCEGKTGLQVLPDDPVKRCVLRAATGIRDESASL